MKTIASPQREKLNANYMRWSRNAALKSSMQRMTQESVKAGSAWMLMPLSLLLSACATPSTVTCKQPEMIPVPVLTEPLPSVSYSLSVVKSLQRWQASVIDMYPTSKP